VVRASIGLVLVAASAAFQSATVRPWTPAGVSSPRFESHAAFDPKTGDMYFVRSSPQFQGWRILMSHCTAAGWGTPEPPAFAGDGVEADPFFTPDGRGLYFISSRTTDGIKGRGLDLWRVDRDDSGVWGTPTRLPEPLNSTGAEWFPRPSADGSLYFGSDRPGGLGATDIWRARKNGTGQWTVTNLGSAVNTAGDEYEAAPSPDGQRLIVMSDGGLYDTHLSHDAWSPRVALGPEINQTGLVVGPLFSPSGRSLLFARDTKGPASGEFFVWRERSDEAWPPECRSK
jgi:Tol biopolymer transport system component